MNNHVQHETLKNRILIDKFNAVMTTIKAFFSKVGALFSDFRKRAGCTLPPSSLVTHLETVRTYDNGDDRKYPNGQITVQILV